MRLLLDECLDEKLRHFFPGFDCHTARYAGFSGLKNGKLLGAAEAAGFNVLLTVDQHIHEQQNLAGRKISLIVLCARKNILSELKTLVPSCCNALRTIEPGQVVYVRS